MNIVEAINFSGMDYEQSMEMLRSNKTRFILKNTEDEIIFRDKKLNTFYYCTEIFIKIIEEHKIKGLKFVKAGKAE